MKVSIREALKNVASEKYDKKNIFLFFVLLFVSGVIAIFLPEELQNQEVMNKMRPEEFWPLVFSAKVVPVWVISSLLGLLSAGCLVVATNNAIKCKQCVFPHPFKEAGNLLAKGFLYYLGCIIVIISIIIIAGFIGFLLGSINLWLLLLVIPIVIIMVHAWLCVNLGFYVTLEFKEWFCFRKNWMMIANMIRRFASYVAKSLILVVLLVVILTSVELLIGSFTMFVGIATHNEQIALIFGTILLSLTQALLAGLISVYCIDLTAQLLSPVAMANKQCIEE